MHQNPYVLSAKKGGDTVVLKYTTYQSERDILEELKPKGAKENHVAQIIKSGEMTSGFVMIFPFYGVPLLRHKEQSGRFLPLVLQLLESLLFIHLNGIAHCDMKPENTLVDDISGNLTIVDFGCAQRVEKEDSLCFEVMGTEGWMAPEVLDGEDKGYIPKLADVWSTGRMIEEMSNRCSEDQRELSDRVRDIADRMQVEEPLQRLSLAAAKQEIIQIMSDLDDEHAGASQFMRIITLILILYRVRTFLQSKAKEA